MQINRDHTNIPIRYEKSNKAKRIGISVRPFKGIRVVVPVGVNIKDAERFVASKTDWIKKALRKMVEHEKKFTIFTPQAYFVTRNHELCFEHTDAEKPMVRVSNGKIKAFIPEFIDLKNDIVQLLIRKGIEKAWAIEAKEILPLRLNKLAKEHGLFYRNLAVKNIKSKWGSCSGLNDIILSIHIVRLPDILMDYVLVHELVHTIHKNHGPTFWHMLNELTGDARGLDEQLNHFMIRIY